MRITLFLLLSFLTPIVFSQTTPEVDSLLFILKDSENKADVLNQITAIYLMVDNDKALEYAEKAFNEAMKSEDKGQMAEALWFKARAQLNLY